MAYKIYDDNKRLIALGASKSGAIAALVVYFQSIPGNVKARNVPWLTKCPMDGVIQVGGSISLPKFLYLNGISDSAKIYPKAIAGLNINSLCNGVTFDNLIPVPTVSAVVTEAIEVVAPVITGILIQDANQYILMVTGHSGSSGIWAIDGLYSSGMDSAGLVTLNISVTNSSISSAATLFSNEPIARINGKGIPANLVTIYGTDNPNIPPTASITIDTLGVIRYSGHATSGTMSSLTIEFFMVKYNVNN